jgi:hypothetical protein
MISELIDRLKKMLREAKAALKSVCTTTARVISLSAGPDVNVIAASEGNVLDVGKRYRKTSGHSPFFSLFTFFANR